MSRIFKTALAGITAVGLTAGTLPAAQAAPLPALTGTQVGGGVATVDQVGWRYGYGGYRRGGIGFGGGLAAGAALGLIGGALAASAAPRYGYGGYGGYGGGYGYARPVYGYPAYGYGYARPAYGYGYYGY